MHQPLKPLRSGFQDACEGSGCLLKGLLSGSIQELSPPGARPSTPEHAMFSLSLSILCFLVSKRSPYPRVKPNPPDGHTSSFIMRPCLFSVALNAPHSLHSILTRLFLGSSPWPAAHAVPPPERSFLTLLLRLPTPMAKKNLRLLLQTSFFGA